MVRGDDDSLPDLFWTVGRQLRGARSLGTEGITPSHARALMSLARHGVLRQRELSDHLRIAPRSTTEVVDALEERGLVARHADPGDRRATLVDLTEAGRTTVRELKHARHAEVEAVFGRLSASEQQTLRRLLRKLADS